MPVDQYIGGIEHAILHLFVFSFLLKIINLCNTKIKLSEPFKNLFTQGMVCHETYKDNNNNWLNPDEVERIDTTNFIKKTDKTKVKVDHQSRCQNPKKILSIRK